MDSFTIEPLNPRTLFQQPADNGLDTIMVGSDQGLQASTGSWLLDAFRDDHATQEYPLIIPKEFGSLFGSSISGIGPTQHSSQGFNSHWLFDETNDEISEFTSLTHNEPEQPKTEQPKTEQPQPENTHPQPATLTQSPDESAVHASAPAAPPPSTPKNGLQLGKYDITYGFVEIKDSLLFAGARQRQNRQGQNNNDSENQAMVFDYLRRQVFNQQVENFLGPDQLSQGFPVTVNLQQTEAGVHRVQQTPILSLKNLEVADNHEHQKLIPSENTQKSTLKTSPESNQIIVADLRKRVDDLTSAVDSLDEKLAVLKTWSVEC